MQRDGNTIKQEYTEMCARQMNRLLYETCSCETPSVTAGQSIHCVCLILTHGTLIFVLLIIFDAFLFFFSSRRRHTISLCDWSSDVCSFFFKQKTAYEITV